MEVDVVLRTGTPQIGIWNICKRGMAEILFLPTVNKFSLEREGEGSRVFTLWNVNKCLLAKIRQDKCF